MSEPVRRSVRGEKIEVVEKPTVIVNYMENMGRMDTADHYMATYSFLRRTLKWEVKLLFWGMEVSVIDIYILCVESCKKNSCIPMGRIKFRRELAMTLVGNFCQDGGASNKRITFYI
jgi:hypothetical protein